MPNNVNPNSHLVFICTNFRAKIDYFLPSISLAFTVINIFSCILLYIYVSFYITAVIIITISKLIMQIKLDLEKKKLF